MSKVLLEQKINTEKVYCLDNYTFFEISSKKDIEEYDKLLDVTYSPLGFLDPKILPKQETMRFGLNFDDELIAICSLTPILDNNTNAFSEVVPMFQGKRLIEMGNVIIKPKFRGNVTLGLLFSNVARYSNRNNYDYVVGITRHKILRHFVDFGVIPVLHEPLHLLGNEDLNDFILYYDTHANESIQYMEERTRRFIYQEYIMASIKEKYIR
jgi:predicted GNAT family N-acyltransferase